MPPRPRYFAFLATCALSVSLCAAAPEPPPSIDVNARRVAGLSAALADGHVSVRRIAVSQLSELAAIDGPHAKASVATLIKALKDPDPEVVESALRALTELGPALITTVPDLAALANEVASLLRSGPERVRIAAASTLAPMGAAALPHTPALIELMADEKIGWYGDRVAAENLIAGLDGAVVKHAKLLLAVASNASADDRGGDAALRLLDRADFDPSPFAADLVKMSATRSAANLSPLLAKCGRALDPHMPELIARVASSQEYGAETLLLSNKPALLPHFALLIDRLDDPDTHARSPIIETLAAIADDPGPHRQQVIAALREGNDNVRLAVTGYITQLSHPTSDEIAAVLGLIGDEHATVADAAAVAFAEVCDRLARQAAKDIRRSFSVWMPVAAGIVTGGPAFPLFAAAPCDDLVFIDDAAANALALHVVSEQVAGISEYLPALKAAIKSSNEETRYAALLGILLAGPGAADFAPDVIAAFADSDRRVREAAGRFFATAGPAVRDDADGLLTMLTDPNPYIRAAAVGALIEFDEAIIARIPWSALLDDPDRAVSSAAIRAMRRLNLPLDQHISRLITLALQDDFDPTALNAVLSAGPAAKPFADRILTLFDSGSIYQRYEVAEFLVGLGDIPSRYVTALLRRGDRPIGFVTGNEDIAKIVASALQSLPPSVAAPHIKAIIVAAYTERWADMDRQAEVLTLANLGPALDPYILDLITALDARDSSLISPANLIDPDSAARLLVALPQTSRHIESLTALLSSQDKNTAQRALSVLAERITDIPNLEPRAVDQAFKLFADGGSDTKGSILTILAHHPAEAKAHLTQIVPILKRDKDSLVVNVLELLKILGPAATPYTNDIAALLPRAHRGAAQAIIEPLVELADATPAHLDAIISAYARWSMEEYFDYDDVLVLARSRYPVSPQQLVDLLDVIHNNKYKSRAPLRAVAYQLAGQDETLLALLDVAGGPVGYPREAVARWPEARRDRLWPVIIDLLVRSWPENAPHARWSVETDQLKAALEALIEQSSWPASRLPQLQAARDSLPAAFSGTANLISSKISAIKTRQSLLAWSQRIGSAIGIHAAFWTVLILIYPYSRRVQAIFFWNPWVRLLFGLAYVPIVLTLFPFLSRRLLKPFRQNLLADARLEQFHEPGFYADTAAIDKNTSRPGRLADLVAARTRPLLLEGESGIGKTMFMRSLALRQKHPVIFLTARRCNTGVLPAIQQCLVGYANDESFVRSLVWSGAALIMIDGLNEVDADTRAEVARFVDELSHSNVILSSQPNVWSRPGKLDVLVLQPLDPPAISAFLLKQQALQPANAPVRGPAYERACREFLDAITALPPAERDAQFIALSNPMDLTVVAAMLARARTPSLSALLQQYYDTMAADFERLTNTEFPLRDVARAAYDMRVSDTDIIPPDRFGRVLEVLADHKMIVKRTAGDTVAADGAEELWSFRHDRIWDYFTAEHMRDKADLLEQHLHPSDSAAAPQPRTALNGAPRVPNESYDARFRGVFLLLAETLPDDARAALFSLVAGQAARTRDANLLADVVNRINRARPGAVGANGDPMLHVQTTAASNSSSSVRVSPTPL